MGMDEISVSQTASMLSQTPLVLTQLITIILVTLQLKSLRTELVGLRKELVDGFQQLVGQMRVDRRKNRSKETDDKDHSELTHMRSYRDTNDEETERNSSAAVAELLENPEIIFATRYKYIENNHGDLDGMVVGSSRTRGDQVVVFIESKHSLKTISTCSEVRNQLLNSVAYWRALSTSIRDDLVADEDVKRLADFDALKVDRLRLHRVVMAFGGYAFSEASVAYFCQRCANFELLRVSNNPVGKFVAFTI